MSHFFISYNKADVDWAQRIGDWLDQSNHTATLQAADFVAGSNFVSEMHAALKQSERMILVLSPEYLSAPFPESEWTAAFARDPIGKNRTLVPVRVRECKPDGLLKPVVYIDLVGLALQQAKERFLREIAASKAGGRQQAAASLQPEERRPKARRMSQKVKGDYNTSIQAEHITNLTIKTTSKKLPSVQPANAVGANIEMRAYLEYLIARYIEWRQWGTAKGIDKRRFHPAMINNEVKRQFGARTFLVPQERFKDLIHYLQVRINDTIKGRNNAHRNYHSYEEHLEILHGTNKKGRMEQTSDKPTTLGEALGSVLSGVAAARKRAQTINCVSNLKQVGLAARMWAEDHGDVLPSNHEELREHLDNPKVLSCSAMKGKPYEILSPGASATKPSIVYLRCPCHGNVGLADGSAFQLGDRRLVQRDDHWQISPPF